MDDNGEESDGETSDGFQMPSNGQLSQMPEGTELPEDMEVPSEGDASQTSSASETLVNEASEQPLQAR